MTEPYSFRTLAHPTIAPEALASFVGLGSVAYMSGMAMRTGDYVLAGLAVMALLGLLVALNRVDKRARELEGLTTR
ncbi:hypothetical protein GOC74_12115 [Halomicrobium mukohataei]|uniref:Uncharacterized protein n=1 Tax=Halomicrobium mukohataei TaxID=57705 RepID=A0A847UGH0_9EURY|nr:hypothetical protein [Halomicrobium mukohataei]NLV10670.1 hypothetical protein [Halomicrobium mukohataei]